MTLTEKVAYLKGLVEGIGVDETTNQGKIMKAVLDVLDDMAFTVSDLEDSTSELYEELEAVDEDLSSLEDEIYGTEEDDECDDDCCCCDDDEDVYEVKCRTATRRSASTAPYWIKVKFSARTAARP